MLKSLFAYRHQGHCLAGSCKWLAGLGLVFLLSLGVKPCGAGAFRASLDKNGGLALTFQGKPLLAPQPPRLYYFDEWVNGKAKRPSKYTWMASPISVEWSASQKQYKAIYKWGSFTMNYQLKPDRVDLKIQVTNKTSRGWASGTFDLSGKFAFPQTPKGYFWSKGWAVLPRDDEPPVAMADFGAGAVVVCLESDKKGAAGFARPGLRLSLLGMKAHQTQTFKISIRLGPGSDNGNDPLDLASDAFANFAKAHPSTLNWPDRRPIATLHPSSSALGSGTSGNLKNPRGWTVGAYQHPIDITTAEELAFFKKQLMDRAKRSVEICQEMNAQGMIVWSIEGQQYPHTISYVGSPNMLGEMAPEMDRVADEYFNIFKQAGLRTGVCLRPQKIELNPDHDPKALPNKPPYKYRQTDLWTPKGEPDEKAMLELLTKKIRYAHDRWGCTLFYVDTNVSTRAAKNPKTGQWYVSYWKLNSADLYNKLAKRFPDFLIMPEHETFSYWAGTAPIAVTYPKIQKVWPEAFSVNLMQQIQDDKPQTIAKLVPMVQRGDILLFQGWWPAPLNRAAQGAYEQVYGPGWKAAKNWPKFMKNKKKTKE